MNLIRCLLRWSSAGYEKALPPTVIDGMLTLLSSLAALRADYQPILHPDARSLRQMTTLFRHASTWLTAAFYCVARRG